MSSELPDPIRQLAQRLKQIEIEKQHVPSMYQPHCPGITLSYPGNQSTRPELLRGGATREQRGKAAEYREKYQTWHTSDYSKLSKVVHDNQDGHVDRSYPGLWNSIDFARIRHNAKIRDTAHGPSDPWEGTDRHGNKVKWYYRDGSGRKVRSAEGEPL